MNKFRESLGQFREAMHREGAQAEIPGLQQILSRDRRAKRLRPQWNKVAWAVAAAVLLIAAVIPVYENVQRQREAEQEKADVVLLEQVNAGLARSVPRAMTPLMGRAPHN